MLRQLVRFALVGGGGFIVDAGSFQAIAAAGSGPFLARAFAIALAVVFTFILNRQLTFRSRTPIAQAFGRYIVVSAMGSGINYAVFALLVAALPAIPPVIAIAAGSAVAMAWNFAGSLTFAFGARPGTTRDLT
jgi:putative flippase GtrA